jgi:DNA-binding CsgD family transcriptional regulator
MGAAIAAMKRVIEVAEHSEDLSSRAKARFHLASFLSFGEGQATQAETACREAVELFALAGDFESELLGRNELAWIEALKGDFAASAKVAEQVWALAKQDGRVDVAAVAAGTAAFSTGVIGDCSKARRYFEEAVELAQESGSSYRVAWAHSLGPHLSMAACGHLGTAVGWCEQALADDPAAPDALAFENLGLAYWLGGRIDEALTVLERSPVRRPIVGSRRRAWGSALAARLYGERGELRRGVSSLERASATYDSQFLVFGAWVGWAAGMLAWFDGRHEDAIAHLEDVAEWLRATGALVYEPLVLADLAEVASEAGRRLVCQEVAERAVEISRHRECKLARWISHYTTAHLHLVRGETEEAAKAATEALAGFEAGDYLLLAAGARRVLGEALGPENRTASAALLEEAARAYDRHGAVWRRDRTLDLLASLGAEGRRAARAVQGPESLTPREREVAELTMRGHTAREVGERLFIGNRTVETHLANIYAKLGVASKRELIQMSREIDLG